MKVPKHLRVGPWKPAYPIMMVTWTSFILYTQPENMLNDTSPATMVSSYPELYSSLWWYNTFAFLMMAGVTIWSLTQRTKAVVVTYTFLSWMMNCVRFGFNVAAPFLSDHHIILQLNCLLRFPALMTATVTFMIWNFALLPYIYLNVLDTKEKELEFTKSNVSFGMVQQHVCNIVLAVSNTIVSCRSQRMIDNNDGNAFDFNDLWNGLAYAILYGLFYNLVLDRVGVHIYPIFSPRTNYSIITWVVVLLIFLAFFQFWNFLILNYMEYMTLSLVMGIHVNWTMSGILMSMMVNRFSGIGKNDIASCDYETPVEQLEESLAASVDEAEEDYDSDLDDDYDPAEDSEDEIDGSEFEEYEFDKDFFIMLQVAFHEERTS